MGCQTRYRDHKQLSRRCSTIELISMGGAAANRIFTEILYNTLYNIAFLRFVRNVRS